MLLLIFSHEGNATHVMAFSGFDYAWSWRFSPEFYSFTPKMVHNTPRHRPDEKKRETGGSATGTSVGESELHVVSVFYHTYTTRSLIREQYL